VGVGGFVFVLVLVLVGGRGVFVRVGRNVDVNVIVEVTVSVGVSARKAIPASNSVLVGEGVAVMSLVSLVSPPNPTKVGVFLVIPFLPWLIPYQAPTAANTTNRAIRGTTDSLFFLFSSLSAFISVGLCAGIGSGEVISCSFLALRLSSQQPPSGQPHSPKV